MRSTSSQVFQCSHGWRPSGSSYCRSMCFARSAGFSSGIFFSSLGLQTGNTRSPIRRTALGPARAAGPGGARGGGGGGRPGGGGWRGGGRRGGAAGGGVSTRGGGRGKDGSGGIRQGGEKECAGGREGGCARIGAGAGRCRSRPRI